MKKILSASIVLSYSLVVTESVVEARPAYFAALTAAYPNAKFQNTLKCAVCHVNGPRTNAFAWDFFQQVLRKSTNGTYDFKPLESLDSDNDGVSNLQELMDGTNPGVAPKANSSLIP